MFWQRKGVEIRCELNLWEWHPLPWPPGFRCVCSEEDGEASTSTRLEQGLGKNCSRAKSMLWDQMRKAPCTRLMSPLWLHPSQYAADPQDKHWLAEQHHTRATGGKMVSTVPMCHCQRPTQPRAQGSGYWWQLTSKSERLSKPDKYGKGDSWR